MPSQRRFRRSATAIVVPQPQKRVQDDVPLLLLAPVWPGKRPVWVETRLFGPYVVTTTAAKITVQKVRQNSMVTGKLSNSLYGKVKVKGLATKK